MTDIDFTPLRRAISGQVYDDAVRRYLLATDGSIFLRHPLAVVYPRSTADVLETVRFAAARGLSIHPRGAGSGLCGAALGRGIVVDFTRHMNRLIDLDVVGRTVTCEPGYRYGQLEAALRGKGLFFPPDPSSGEYATFGGMLGTNASGAHSVKYGNVADYIVDAEVVTADGRTLQLSDIRNRPFGTLPPNLRQLWRLYMDNADRIEAAYPPVRCNVAGYNLRGLVRDDRLCLERLFAGAEGTLGLVTRLTFRLLEKPAHNSLVVAFFDTIDRSAEAVQRLLPMGPSGIEIMDKSLLRLARETEETLREKIPEGVDNVLLIEFDANDPETAIGAARGAQRQLTVDGLSGNVHLAVSETEKDRFWAVRKAAVPILYRLKGRKKILALIEDAAVPTDRLADYVTGIYDILDRRNVDFVVYGHIAKGLLHTRPLLDLKSESDVGRLRVLADAIFELVYSLNGTVSGEHGDGRLRSAYIRKRYPEIHPLFHQTKTLFDPENLFNPEIKTAHDPDQMARHLRYGSRYRAEALPDLSLNWPEGFCLEAEKCHGCSKCTTVTEATRMCPVYKFTRDEMASPKAKANVLRGLISGAIDDRYLYDHLFQQVMDLCAGCGSCYKECPSNVNIPKLAVEAKAQYTRRYGAPIGSRLLSGLEAAGRFTRKLSPVLSRVMGFPQARKAAERIVGLSADRPFIALAPRSFFERRRRSGAASGRPRVLYFAGCYSGYVRPEIGEAAVAVLTAMGMTVQVPDQHCCGLPMLAKGMVGEAADKVRQNLNRWRHRIADADVIVVTCSSCGYALMRDWSDLVSGPDIDAVRKKTIHISQLIHHHIDRLRVGPRRAKIAYHAPCHLKIQPHADSSVRLLSGLPGVAVTALNSHCCGMIGSWGLTAENDGLSRRIAADMLSKGGRVAPDFWVTDCPTCRMQIEQLSAATVRHPVEVVAAMLDERQRPHR